MRSPLTTPMDPWDTRFGFFWYNDQEIFHASQEDLNRQAEALAETGINHVITFSCTHFRWSFRRHWGAIEDALARVVTACHEHGIRVTEHHSSHLTFNPLNDDDVAYMDRILKVRGSTRASWPHLLEESTADPEVNGVPFSTFRQIDGRTGSWARSNYRGWCLCFNNPDYRQAYFEYLETLYALGIDGIMTDDVQWFAEGHACACGHCRSLYVDQTGYEMPAPGPDWDAWHGNTDDPSYVAWLDFRFRANEHFHGAVKAHYEGLGLRPLRPNYVSTALSRNWTAYTLEALPDLDWVFQECCFSTIIRYSWPGWAVEAWHRYAVGRWRGIPAMAMFYPDRPDAMRFTWALAMSWGVLYLATPEGFSMNEEELALRAFEREHARLLRGQERIARIGFYDSRTNRNLYGQAEARSLRGMKAWMQACYRGNVPFDLFHREELDRLGGYDVAVLNEVAMLSDEEWTAFRSFVVNGGTLVMTGRSGERDEKGIGRPPDYLAKAWGLYRAEWVDDGGEGVVHPVGEGRLALLAGDWGLEPFEPMHNADRWQEEEVRVPFHSVSAPDRQTRRDITALLTGLLPDGPELQADGLPEDVTVTVFGSADGQSLVVHLVNTAKTLDVAPGETIGHSDPVPLPAHHVAPVTLKVRKPESLQGGKPVAARWHEPESEEAIELKVADEDERVAVEVDVKRLRCYGMVEIAFGG